jgi:DNA-binding CsgD family transcriptional regulator
MSTQLSKRQKEVVRLVSLGCTIVEAAKILGLSPATVTFHRDSAMARLGARRAALLTRVALKMRLTSMKDKLTAAEKRKCGRRDDGWN